MFADIIYIIVLPLKTFVAEFVVFVLKIVKIKF